MTSYAQKNIFTYEDTLRGSNTIYRNWWDIKKYTLQVQFYPKKKYIQGSNTIVFQTFKKAKKLLQIDLQKPLVIDSILFHHNKENFISIGNAYIVTLSTIAKKMDSIIVYYHGNPHEAENAPWQGGVVWTKDSLNRDWFAVACQALGASAWYPCKDYQGDEPNDGAEMYFTVPADMMMVSNGRFKEKIYHTDSTTTYYWQVISTINNYDISFYGGNYVCWKDSMMAKKGKLDITYWCLDYNIEKAKKQFAIVPKMIQCFEEKIGQYPFYKDGYQLIESPYLGMEHQSAVAYGNGFKNGYLGKDLSHTGIGKKFDFIIVHESAHEWFGNSITAKDLADMWLQEAFTSYAESIFIECMWGRDLASLYIKGTRKNILNDRPIIGKYGVNDEGSGDMYYKGANMIEMIRRLLNNDEKFFSILKQMSQQFYHKTVTTQHIEKFWTKETKLKKLPLLFDDYLHKIEVSDFDIHKYKNP